MMVAQLSLVNVAMVRQQYLVSFDTEIKRCSLRPAAEAGGDAEPDAAVGAFVRLIQEAPPLQRSSPASRPDSLTGGRPSSGGTGSSEMSLQVMALSMCINPAHAHKVLSAVSISVSKAILKLQR